MRSSSKRSHAVINGQLNTAGGDTFVHGVWTSFYALRVGRLHWLIFEVRNRKASLSLSLSLSLFGKFLGSPGVWWNCAPSSHIHGGPHYKFNEWTLPWMWEEEALFSVLQKYLRITLFLELLSHGWKANDLLLLCRISGI